MYFGVKVHDED